MFLRLRPRGLHAWWQPSRFSLTVYVSARDVSREGHAVAAGWVSASVPSFLLTKGMVLCPSVCFFRLLCPKATYFIGMLTMLLFHGYYYINIPFFPYTLFFKQKNHPMIKVFTSAATLAGLKSGLPAVGPVGPAQLPFSPASCSGGSWDV